jgi:hypothetical protein
MLAGAAGSGTMPGKEGPPMPVWGRKNPTRAEPTYLGRVVARGALLVATLLLVACGGKAPYEGKSVADLDRMLHDGDATVRTQGAIGLSKLGPAAAPAVPALVEASRAPEPLLRQNAALALGQIGPEAREAVPDLIKLLDDPEWAVRRQAAVALGGIGPDAREAAAALEQLGRDPHQVVRKAAAEALTKVR